MNAFGGAVLTELNAFYAENNRRKRTFVEKRDFYSLSFRCSGKISVETQEEELWSDENSVTFIPKGCSYFTEIIEDTHMLVVHFKLSNDIDFRNPYVLKINDIGIREAFEAVFQAFRADEAIDYHCVSSFYELLSRLKGIESGEEREKSKIPHKILLAREYMYECSTDVLFSIASLASRLGVSSSYLRREFSKAYGKSPIAFLRELRVAKAKSIMSSEFLSIAQIAEQSGFSSASYFIQVFHKLVGESPDKYRQRLYSSN